MLDEPDGGRRSGTPPAPVMLVPGDSDPAWAASFHASSPTALRGDAGPAPAPGRSSRRAGLTSAEWLTVALVGLLLARPRLVGAFDAPAIATWSTIFVSIVVQALPFLVLGVLLSATISVFVRPSVFTRLLPRNQALAVPVAGMAGAVLPGCECASVPVAGSLMSRGVAPSAALAFMLAAPAINPIVLVATAVAFPGRPEVVAARFTASLLAAVVVGWLWARLGRAGWLRIPSAPFAEGTPKPAAFRAAARHDLLHAGGFLVVGGMTAATLNVVVPRDWLAAVAERPVLSVLALAGLAVVLAICSEADAFVAASLSDFSLTARLAFLVVGPMVDVKLIALQAGSFGRGFALRFAPVTFGVAVLSSVAVGAVLL